MQNRIPIMIFLLSLWIFMQTISAFANEEKVVQDNKGDTAANEIMKTREEHSGLQRNLGFSNFLEGWFTPWDAYEENEDQAPRVPLLRITPAFFKREVRFNYIYVNDEHKGEADVNEWGMAFGASVNTPYQGRYRTKSIACRSQKNMAIKQWLWRYKGCLKNHASGIQYFLFIYRFCYKYSHR